MDPQTMQEMTPRQILEAYLQTTYGCSQKDAGYVSKRMTDADVFVIDRELSARFGTWYAFELLRSNPKLLAMNDIDLLRYMGELDLVRTECSACPNYTPACFERHERFSSFDAIHATRKNSRNGGCDDGKDESIRTAEAIAKNYGSAAMTILERGFVYGGLHTRAKPLSGEHVWQHASKAGVMRGDFESSFVELLGAGAIWKGDDTGFALNDRTSEISDPVLRSFVESILESRGIRR